MAQQVEPETQTPKTKKQNLEKSYEILTCTAKSPRFSYAHLELITSSIEAPASSLLSSSEQLDNLQVKSYCTSALRQFLGLTGQAIPVDVLKVQGVDCWVRVPKPDLSMFAAAITAWRGSSEDGVIRSLRLTQCSDWLGSMVGSDGQDRLWTS